MNPLYLLSEFLFSLRHGRQTIDRWRLARNALQGRVPIGDRTGADRVKLRVLGRTLEIELRRGTADTAVLMQVFHYGEYNAPGIRWPTIQTVIDAGANIGLSSLLFWARSGGRAKIVAIEPESSNLRLLKRNLNELNDCRADIVPAALWHESTTLDLRVQGQSVSHTVRPDVGIGPVSKPVDAITPDSLFPRVGAAEVDIFKIDIEGGEKQIFSDPSLKGWARSVRHFLIECHSHFGFGASPADIERALVPLGFDVTVYDREKGLVCASRS